MAFDYKVGDKIQSHPESSDVTCMKAVWVGEIIEVIGANDNGGCYKAVGTFHPCLDNDGNMDDFWLIQLKEKGEKFYELGFRQLHGNHLVPFEMSMQFLRPF